MISPLVKFSLYCIFIILSVNYLTKNRLDDNSKYLIMAMLIIPYLYIDTLSNFTNVDENDNESFSNSSKSNLNSNSTSNSIKKDSKFINTKQPEIKLSKHEEITNKNVEEEIKIKNSKLEHFNSENISEEQIRRVLQKIQNEKIIEKLDNAPTDMSNNQPNTSTENTSIVSLSDNPDYQPLGENGNNFTNKWDHDYLLLDTEKWAPTMKPAPVCKTEKVCPVCPSLSTGNSISLKDFDLSRKITPPVNSDLTKMNN
jgi:hypothetical protein